MANEVLKSLLKEYENKRIKEEIELDKRKEKLYASVPRLGEIEEELGKYAIQTAKEIIKNNTNKLEELNEYIEKLKKEKQEILKKNNINMELLEPKYECRDCKDTGYITNSDYTTSMCHCLKQKMLNKLYNKSNLSNLNKENFNTFNINIFSTKKDERYGISPKENMEYIYKKSLEFVEKFENPEIKNLLFTGNIGLRKNIYVKLHCKRIAKKRKNSIVSNCTCFT